MPTADAVLLPLCIGLTLIGVVVTVLLWRRSSRGRVVQGIGWTLAPVGLYFSGLLRLVWDGISALVGWAGRLVFSPAVWAGLSVLVVAVLAIAIGGALARRSAGRPVAAKPAPRAAEAKQTKAVGPGRTQPTQAQAQPKKNAAPAADDDMDEIEAILRNRGIN